MQDARSWFAAWQSMAPILTGIFMIVIMKSMSRHWAAATLARTARVASKLRGTSARSRAFRR